MRIRIGLGIVLAASVISGGIWLHAQGPRVVPGPRLTSPNSDQAPPEIISGADFGFRVERWDGDTPVGKVVVRHDGKWVEVRIPVTPRRVSVK